MGTIKTLGGDRLGAGKKMTVMLDNFGRSSHNLGHIFTTDQACGTLVPYDCEIGLNGTTFYIDMETNVRTLPTNGPVFGSFKHQIDWFLIPIRLYIAALHNNALGIGLSMDKVYLPTMTLANSNTAKPETKIAQDSLLAYLGLRQMPNAATTGLNMVYPAIFLLAYWDIYKNYYANKQEEIGVFITPGTGGLVSIYNSNTKIGDGETNKWLTTGEISSGDKITLNFNTEVSLDYVKSLPIADAHSGEGNGLWNPNNWTFSSNTPSGIATSGSWVATLGSEQTSFGWTENWPVTRDSKGSINLKTFDLANIDEMRNNILAAAQSSAYNINSANIDPYMTILGTNTGSLPLNSGYTEVGLGIKTYLSDRFNNWLSTEWIDGVNGVNEISAVDVSSGSLSMDALILAKKVFDMMNRIAISGGSYNDWQEAVYGTKTIRMAESPIYMGGMSSEIAFDEVVSNSSSIIGEEEQPLGTLAGRGIQRYKKGGRGIKIKCEEPSMLICIGSITPRICYSQGNKWWTRLKTMNDFHKPNLDAIGFQELVTDEFVGCDTRQTSSGITYNSVGKQPSWIEYMTAVNESYGSFAANGELEWMVLNRKYSTDDKGQVTDATTYIDPTLYNIAFANARLDAKNFWVNVGFDITARRVMSAKQIPNL